MKAIKRNVALLAAMGLMAGSGAVWAAATATDTFTATATLTAAVTVTCGASSLDFGTVSRVAGYTSGTEKITIAAASGFAVTAGEGLATNGASGVSCTIADETGSNATAALSAVGATWSSPKLSGVALDGAGEGGGRSLSADLTLSQASAIGIADTLYIGGELTVKNSTDAPNATYTSGTITLTVTE